MLVGPEPVSVPPSRWGVSSLDARAHAIDEDADHPYGVYVTRCGQRLSMGTSLHDEPPGWICLSCLRRSGPGTSSRGPVRSPARWARSPLDYHAHLLLPAG
jgi:hypothetical protein